MNLEGYVQEAFMIYFKLLSQYLFEGN